MKPTKPIPKAQRRRVEVNLTGSRFRNVDLTGAQIRGAIVDGMEIDGLVGGLTVNGVDVVPFVEAELDARYPERVALREGTAGGLREAWLRVESRWQDIESTARSRPDGDLARGVDGEWSLLETLRHLVFVTDSWFSRCVRREPRPFWPAGLASTDLPVWFSHACGLDPKARPDVDEAFAVRAGRRRAVGEFTAGVTADDLAASCPRNPAKGYPADPRKYTVGRCLRVGVTEELEHAIIAARDLALLDKDYSYNLSAAAMLSARNSGMMRTKSAAPSRKSPLSTPVPVRFPADLRPAWTGAPTSRSRRGCARRAWP